LLKRCSSPFVFLLCCCNVALLSGCLTIGWERDKSELSPKFTPQDIVLIRMNYMRNNTAEFDMGRPPAPLKRISRPGYLSPDIRGMLLPRSLEKQLSELPRGCVRKRIDTTIVIIRKRTREITDVIYEVGM
jgi:hypothetical protein